MIGLGWIVGIARVVPWQAWLVAGVVALGGIWHWSAVRRAHEAGRAAAIEAIEAANREANRKAGEGEAAVIACHARGKDWNRETGKCAE